MENNKKVDPAQLEKAKTAMKTGLVTVIKGLLTLLLKTAFAMVAINWLDLLKHPLTFAQTLVLALVVNMLFAKANVINNITTTKQNPNNDGTTRGNDVDNNK